jgi:nicotinamide-nucleotide adenylyltransferase
MSSTTLKKVSAALEQHVSSKRAFTIVWRSTPEWPRLPPTANGHQIAILDSSFNPPTLAHLALAKAASTSAARRRATGQLFLYSTRNADKGTGTSADATAEQRLHMMVLLAKSSGLDNVAVACCSEPIIAAKSTLILQALPSPARLIFLLGWDTITRFFARKYYQDMSQVMRQFFREELSTIVCARRGQLKDEEDAFMASGDVVEYARDGRIDLVDLAVEMVGVSSTEARKAVRESKVDDEARRRLEPLVAEDVASYVLQQSLYRQ